MKIPTTATDKVAMTIRRQAIPRLITPTSLGRSAAGAGAQPACEQTQCWAVPSLTMDGLVNDRAGTADLRLTSCSRHLRKAD